MKKFNHNSVNSENHTNALDKVSASYGMYLIADHNREPFFSGMIGSNRAALSHFCPVAMDAKRLKTAFDAYGNLAAKSLNEETSAIYNLLQELNETSEKILT